MREVRQQVIVRVDAAQRLKVRVAARPLVGLRGHDQPVESLERPAVLDQVGGQPVEQLGVGGPGTDAPKLLGVATIGLPKWCCQTRLTMDRVASGFRGSAIHRARPSRRPVRSSGRT